MVKKDYHIHTTYSDGKDDMESVVIAAIDSGASEIGFSDHSYTFFDQSYCMKKDYRKYIAEIKKLKTKYSDKIKICADCCRLNGQSLSCRCRTDNHQRSFYVRTCIHSPPVCRQYG